MKISTCYVLLAISLSSTVAASPLTTNSGLHRRVNKVERVMIKAQKSGQKAWAALEKKLKDKTADVDTLTHYQNLYHVDYLKLSTAEVGGEGDPKTMVSETPFKRGPPANSGAAENFGKLPAIFPGISTAKDYYLVALSSMPRGTESTPPPFKFNSVEIAYENYYDAKNGVIVAASNYQQMDKNIQPKITPQITLSSLLYYTYQAAAQREKTNVKNLKYMVQWEIESTQTGLILTEIHTGAPAGTWLVWTHQSTPNRFLHLVGSDNGRSVAFMLADFSQAFEEKTICAVLTNIQLKVMVWVFSTGTPSKCPAAYKNDPAKKIQLGADPQKRKASTSPPRSPGSNPNKKPSRSRPGSPAR